MGVQRSPELEQIVAGAHASYQRGEADALEEMISHDPAAMTVGTDPGEIWTGHDEIVEGLRAEIDNRPEDGGFESTIDRCTGFAAGEIGWAFTEGKFRLSDGSEIPTRGVWIFRREDGAWKSLQSFYSIAVPNSALEPGSALAAGLSAAVR